MAGALRARNIPFAVVGAGAMAVRGVARGTRDLDVLAVATDCLRPQTWSALPTSITVDIRRGDADDPLAGVVRFTGEGAPPLDLIVGKSRWQDGILERAETFEVDGVAVPVATVADLILLKLYAGGPQDGWDITQLLGVADDRDIVEAQVEDHLPALPEECRRLWARIREH